jgi:hypothetical protein
MERYSNFRGPRLRAVVSLQMAEIGFPYGKFCIASGVAPDGPLCSYAIAARGKSTQSTGCLVLRAQADLANFRVADHSPGKGLPRAILLAGIISLADELL